MRIFVLSVCLLVVVFVVECSEVEVEEVENEGVEMEEGGAGNGGGGGGGGSMECTAPGGTYEYTSSSVTFMYFDMFILLSDALFSVFNTCCVLEGCDERCGEPLKSCPRICAQRCCCPLGFILSVDGSTCIARETCNVPII